MKKVLEERKDIAFYIIMYPLVSIHDDAYRKSKTIVCEQSLMLLEEAFARKPIPDPTCETDAIDRFLAIGRELGVTGTPTIFFESGKRVSGSRKAEELIRLATEGR